MIVTARERVLTSLRHEQPDWAPYQLDAASELKAKVVAETENPNFWREAGNHLAKLEFGGFTEIGPNLYKDIFGVILDRSVDKDIGVVKNYLLAEGELKAFIFPEPSVVFPEEGTIKAFLQENQERFRVFNIGFSMFERAWTLRGMEQILMDMLEEPVFVHTLLDRILEFNLSVIDQALEYDFDAVHFGDDWVQQHGLLMGPKLWREFIKPRVAAMYARVKEKGRYVVQHSCGDIQELFPDLIAIGLDVFNTFQSEVMDVVQIKKEYRKNLTFYGLAVC